MNQDFVDESDHIGTIAAGKQADLVLVRGNPPANVSDVRTVEVVFKDGVGYDPGALIDSTQGAVGQARCAKLCAVVRRSAHCSSIVRSLGLIQTETKRVVPSSPSRL